MYQSYDAKVLTYIMCNTLKHFSFNFYHFCNGYVYTFQFSVILKENKSEGKYNAPES